MGSAIIDLAAIRRAAQEGLPVMPQTILILLDRIERTERELIYDRSEMMRSWAESMGWESEALAGRPVIRAARAWAGAIEQCDGIAAAEQELLKAIKGLS